MGEKKEQSGCMAGELTNEGAKKRGDTRSQPLEQRQDSIATH